MGRPPGVWVRLDGGPLLEISRNELICRHARLKMLGKTGLS